MEKACVMCFALLSTLIFLLFLSKQFIDITTYEILGPLRPCDFTPTTNISSTENDAIFTSSTTFNHRIEFLIRSIRTTGCKAKIYMFTPEGVHIPLNILSAGVIQVISSPLTSRVQRSPEKARWEWYHSFLTESGVKFDRIMHTDALDSFYFGDPFTLISNSSKLYVQLEETTIEKCQASRELVTKCHHDLSKVFFHHTIASCGLLGGGHQAFSHFVKILVTHNEWPMCWGKGNDLGDFNYVLWKNIHNFPFETSLMNCSHGFTTMNSCMNKKKLWNSNRQLISSMSEKPLIYANHYDKIVEASVQISTMCAPNENVKFS